MTTSSFQADISAGYLTGIFCLDGADLAASLGARADVVGGLGQGGYLVETTNFDYIELARPRSVKMSLGATILPGLTGNAALPA